MAEETINLILGDKISILTQSVVSVGYEQSIIDKFCLLKL